MVKNNILIGIFVFLCIALNGTILYNETFLFSGGGTIQETQNSFITTTGSTTVTNYSIGNSYLNFDTYKIYNSIRAPVYAIHKLPSTSVRTVAPTFNTNKLGTHQKMTFMEAYIDGTLYGSGSIGWTDILSGTGVYEYYITFGYINTAYANSLTGWKEITFIYNKTVYTDYFNNITLDTIIDDASTRTDNTRLKLKSGHAIGGRAGNKIIFEYGFSNNVNVVLNNDTALTGYLNVTKEYSNNTIQITNQSGNALYYQTTNTNDISEYVILNEGLSVNIYNIPSSLWVNRTVFDIDVLLDTNYDIYFSKNYYSLGEQLIINYNITNASNNYYYGINLYNSANILVRATTLNNTIGSIAPLHSLTEITTYTAYLTRTKKGTSIKEYLDFNQTGYGVIQDVSEGNLTTNKLTYFFGESVTITYNISSSGRLVIENSGFTENINVNSGNNQIENYYIPLDYPTGTTNIYLEYFDGYQYNILDHRNISIIGNGSNFLEVSKSNYYQGEYISTNAYLLSDSGYLLIKDNSGIVKFNSSILANTLTQKTYLIKFTDNSGLWDIELYNTTGKVFSLSITVIEDYFITVTPTPQITVSEEIALIDVPNELAIMIFGNIDSNNDDAYSNNEVITLLNKVFMSLLLVGVILIILGVKKKW